MKIEHDFNFLRDYGANLANRTLLLSGDIEKPTLDRLMGALEVLDKSRELITVKLFSFGGSIYEGLGIYDALRYCKSTIRIIGFGAVMSMGTVILQAADEGERWLMPNSTVMCHMGGNSLTYDHPEQNRRNLAEADRVRDRAFTIVSNRMSVTLKAFNKKFQFDTYMAAEDAVGLGIADKVVDCD